VTWSSDVAICNGALGLLGAEGITALSDSTKQGQLCNLFYEQVRDETMRAFRWNFCIRQTTLNIPLDSSDANAPIMGWEYGFALPASNSDYCLRVLKTDGDEDYVVRGRYLYCNSTSINIEYIRRVLNPDEYDSHFKIACAANLAAHLAMPITKSKTMMESMVALYRMKIEGGYGVDSQEGTPEELQSNELIEVRYG
jgi:hypothetical protein